MLMKEAGATSYRLEPTWLYGVESGSSGGYEFLA